MPSAERAFAGRHGAASGTGTSRTGRPAASASTTRLQPIALGDGPLIAGPGLLRRPARGGARRDSRSAASSSVSISSASATGSIRPSGWATAPGSWARITWQIASVSRIDARNWFPSPSPCEAPLTRPAMSWKSIVSWTTSEAAERLGDPLQALVGHRHHGDVRLDGGERVVAGLGPGGGERVEQGRLARVGHPDDADLHRAPEGNDQAEGGAEDRAGEHVGRVVHAEVRPADGDRRGEDEEERGLRRDPRHRGRAGERGRRVRGREAQRARRAAERRQALEHRPWPPDDQLDREVEPDRDRTEETGDEPVVAVVGIDERHHDPDDEPDRAVLAELAEGLARRPPRRDCGSGCASHGGTRLSRLCSTAAE